MAWHGMQGRERASSAMKQGQPGGTQRRTLLISSMRHATSRNRLSTRRELGPAQWKARTKVLYPLMGVPHRERGRASTVNQNKNQNQNQNQKQNQNPNQNQNQNQNQHQYQRRGSSQGAAGGARASRQCYPTAGVREGRSPTRRPSRRAGNEGDYLRNSLQS